MISTTPQVTDLSGIHNSAKRIVVRHCILFGKCNSKPDFSSTPQDQKGEHLNQQFRYFRSTFVSLASQSSIPLPLEIVEDEKSRLFTFVRHEGPKVVLDILTNHSENIALVRCGLSLLIVTVSLLSLKLDEALVHPNSSHQSHEHHKHHHTHTTSHHPLLHHHPIHGTLKEVKHISAWEWAARSLHGLCEAGGVSVITTLLTSTVIPGIQELSANLLVLIVEASSDAVLHMLLPPNSLLAAGVESLPAATTNRAPSPPIPEEATDRAKHINPNPDRDLAEFNRQHARAKAQHALQAALHKATASTQSFPSLAKRLGISIPHSSHDGSRPNLLSSKSNDGKPASANSGSKKSSSTKSCAGGIGTNVRIPAESNGYSSAPSCLSQILATVMMQKNGHGLIAGCAEIISAMVTTDSAESDGTEAIEASSMSRLLKLGMLSQPPPLSELCLTIAMTSAVPIEPGTREKVEKKNHLSLDHGNNKGSDEALGRVTDSPSVHWASLRIFLRFLSRNARYRGENKAIGGSSFVPNRSTTPMKASQHKNADMTAAQSDALAFTYSQVMLALSKLISHSVQVARQILAIKGAEGLFKQSARGIVDPRLHAEVQAALDRLKQEKRLLNRAVGKVARGGGAGHSTLTTSISTAAPAGQGLGQEIQRPRTTGGHDGTRNGCASSQWDSSHPAERASKGAPRPFIAVPDSRPSTAPVTLHAARANSASSPHRSLSPLIPYSMPESPQRRGLSPKHQSRDDDTSLHKAVFGSLSTVPYMPPRMDPTQAMDFVETLPRGAQPMGRKVLEAVTKDVVGKLTWEGFMRNGQHSVPILERATRTYLPQGWKSRSGTPVSGAGIGLDKLPISDLPVEMKQDSDHEAIEASQRSVKYAAEKYNVDAEEGVGLRGLGYGALGMSQFMDFDGPDMQHEFRPIYEIDINSLVAPQRAVGGDADLTSLLNFGGGSSSSIGSIESGDIPRKKPWKSGDHDGRFVHNADLLLSV